MHCDFGVSVNLLCRAWAWALEVLCPLVTSGDLDSTGMTLSLLRGPAGGHEGGCPLSHKHTPPPPAPSPLYRHISSPKG